jgi:hypothetical protein
VALAVYGNYKIQEVVEKKKASVSPAGPPLKALCRVGPRGNPCNTAEPQKTLATGLVSFEDDGKECKISYSITGLAPGAHGFHIHEKADFFNGCISAGPHYNPHNVTHGGPGKIRSQHNVCRELSVLDVGCWMLDGSYQIIYIVTALNCRFI